MGLTYKVVRLVLSSAYWHLSHNSFCVQCCLCAMILINGPFGKMQIP